MSTKKSIKWDEQPLGEVSDHELARQLSVLRTAVTHARTRRGIKPHSPCQIKGIDWDSQPLGEMSDNAISRQLGVRQGVVSEARSRRGISSYTVPCSVCGTRIKSVSESDIHLCGLCFQVGGFIKLENLDDLSISEKKAKLLANLTPERLEKYRAKRRKNNE